MVSPPTFTILLNKNSLQPLFCLYLAGVFMLRYTLSELQDLYKATCSLNHNKLTNTSTFSA